MVGLRIHHLFWIALRFIARFLTFLVIRLAVFKISFKPRYTVIVLIPITPQCAIDFVSNGFCGRVSDKEGIASPGVFSKPNDLNLADRGFPFDEIFVARVELRIDSKYCSRLESIPNRLLIESSQRGF